MEPFDPLSLDHIGVTLAVELLEQPLHQLPLSNLIKGAGVYAIYYSGTHPAYERLVNLDKEKGGWKYPVYIGSAVRENSKQGFNPRPTTATRVVTRVKNHVDSISAVEKAGIGTALKLSDFRCRFLLLNDAYITLAESVLIATFRPAWNGMGFGSKVVGERRMTGKGSLWDSLHPGRGGRPAGDREQNAKAKAKIQESIDRLHNDPADPKVARMVEKIKRFL